VSAWPSHLGSGLGRSTEPDDDLAHQAPLLGEREGTPVLGAREHLDGSRTQCTRVEPPAQPVREDLNHTHPWEDSGDDPCPGSREKDYWGSTVLKKDLMTCLPFTSQTMTCPWRMK
jgi:hypothetical protein